jgi:3-hydroxy-9,10-secoandrosta-1,3,5(10)-triene-9,17-dione monooxygenase
MTIASRVPGAIGAIEPPEPDLTPAALIARAEALRPSLIERQEETEEGTRYPPITHRDFLDAGFYRMLVPRRYGGYEFDLPTFAKVAMEIGRGCPSSGWGLCLASGHALQVATFWGEEAQAQVFGDGDFRCAAALSSRELSTRRPDGWQLDGVVPYASGAPFSTHVVIHARAKDAPATPMMVIVPRSEWELLDDWGNTLGLRGSGSNSVRFDRARIPSHFALPGIDLHTIPPTRETPGYLLHGNPMYAHRPMGFFGIEAASVVIGMAKGALDAYELQLARNTAMPPIVPRREDPDFQRWFGTASARIDAAETMLLGAARHFMDVCARVEEGVAFSVEEDLRIAMIAREALRLAWETISDDVIRTGGTSGLLDGQRMQRIVRDMVTAWSHQYNLMADAQARQFARAKLGIADAA